VGDVRTALRALRRRPGFAAVVILTLAVVIGANTAIFSVVDGVLLRPLPYPEPDRLVRVAALLLPQAGGDEMSFSDRGYWHFVENGRAFEGFGGYEGAAEWPLTGEGPPLQIQVRAMTVSAFELLGVRPALGRLPAEEEGAPDGPQVALLSDALWRTVFGADPQVLGRVIELNGSSREVIGVMPPDYDFPTPETELWIPDQLDPASENFGGHHIEAIARLAPGATVESALADSESLIGRFSEAGYGPVWFEGVFSGEATARTLQEDIVGDAREPVLILFGTAALVLLVACGNIANLFLARAEARARETAVHLALGSGRGSLIRFVLAESMILGIVGGTLGVLLAYAGTRALVAAAPPMIPRLEDIRVSGAVLAFTALVSVAAGLVVGLLPALRAGSTKALDALKEGGRGGTAGRSRRRARAVLVTLQIAISLVLVVGSVLMVRSFAELRAVDPGFDPEGVLTFGVSPPPNRYENPEAVARFYDDLIARLRGLPAVSAVGAVNTLPLTGGGAVLTTIIDDFPPAEGEFPPVFVIRRATPGYFEAMGIPVAEGREFIPDDHGLRLGSLLINESFKAEYWPTESALGKRMTTAGAPARVVGVVGDIRDTGLSEPAEQFIYKPMLDSVGGGVRPMRVVIRSSAEPTALVPAVRGIVADMDPDLPITDLRPMDDIVSDSLSRTTFTMSLLALAAAVALLLGAVGIYGVMSYTVSQRTGEIGVRQALGADAGNLRRLVVAEGSRLALIGIALGLGGALLLGRLLQSLLFGVSPYDPIALVAGSVVFFGVAVLATLVPSARAVAVPPATALRAE
jgi:predicted permease